jgi:hypothetical protein
VPTPTATDYLAGHCYYALAHINPAGTSLAITDRRQTRLTLADLEHRMQALEDALAPAFNAMPNQFAPRLGAPGTNVTLAGLNFTVGTTTVRFGTVPATIVELTATRIVVRVPSMPPGAVRISVTTSGGTAVSDDTFSLPYGYGSLTTGIGGALI